MHQQYINQQQPGNPYGGTQSYVGGMQPPLPPSGSMRPQPPNPNGPGQFDGRGPPGPPGNYGPPVKSGLPPGTMQNGPNVSGVSGAMGDQYSQRNGYPQAEMGPTSAGPSGSAPVQNPLPGRGPPTMGPGSQNLTSQMGALNISAGHQGPSMLGMMPNQSQNSQPPTNFPSGQFPPRQPLSSGIPPQVTSSVPGIPMMNPVLGNVPPGGMMPPPQPPLANQAPHAPTGGIIPPNSIGQPNSMMPPTSVMPPNSMGQSNTMMPPNSIGQPNTMMPPNSVGQPNTMMPPNSMGQPNTMMPPSPSGGGSSTSVANSVYNQNYPMSQPNSYQQHGSQAPLGQQPQGLNYNTAPQGVGNYPSGPGPRAQTPSGPMSGPSQQPRKLDPDHMPSPIQVIEDDKRAHGGAFPNAARGTAPPLVTSNFIVEDQGNSSPRFIRSTMYNIPVSSDMMNTCKIPFATTITPFAKLLDAEQPPPIVDLGQLGPVRCNRCKAYMCPYMQYIDGGRRFQCVFCNCNTEVPAEYFAHLDHTGRRTDLYDKPELCLGTYEFVATTDYCKENKLPNPPAFIFMIDVSYNSVKSGLVHIMCDRLKEDILYNLPKELGAEESEVRVGFVTYHKELHFYNVKGSLAQPQMMVVSDIEDVFVPLLDGFLVKLSESEAVIDSLLSQIPTMFAENRETEIVLGPVIQAGLDALKSADCSGKLFIFHSSLPVAQAPGLLKNRDDRKLLGTEKEKTILTPQSNFYTKLGQECVNAGCGVELFLFPNSYIDVASVSEVSRLTGGGVHKFQYFQADLNGNQFMDDLKRVVEKPVAFDCVMRVRTSTGIRPVDFFGNFHMSNTTDVELATIDCDKAVTVEIKHDDKLSETEGAFLQAAVLYTSVSGQRRLRIINQSFNCCTQMADLFRNCELDALINYMSKLALRQTLNGSPKQVREHIMNQCAQILACYRQKCASPSSAGQLILPECMKLLPVYSNCVIKSNMLQGGGDISTDDRSWLMFLVNSMSVKSSQAFFYPRLLPLHSLDLESNSLPVAVRCSYERLQEDGAYIIENGLAMLMWVGHNINPQWVQDVFGVHSAAQIDIDKTKLEDLDNPLSKRIRGIVTKIREERQKFIKLIILRQRDKLEPLFQQYLVEDRGANGTASYVDFLCHIHKEIRNLLS